MTIKDYKIVEENEFGKKFVDYRTLPNADINEFVFSEKPRNEYSFPFGVAVLGREVWRVESKKLFNSEIFPEGTSNKCTIEKPHDKDFFIVVGHSPIRYHAETLEQAKQLAANYIQALEFYKDGLIVYRWFSKEVD